MKTTTIKVKKDKNVDKATVLAILSEIFLGEYILLTNFYKYLEVFSKKYNTDIKGQDKPMPHATTNGITIINFNMGSANAATIIDLLTAIKPKACLFLGKCGGLKKKNKIW